MNTPNISTNSNIDPQLPVHPTVPPRISAFAIITTAIIFTLVGATAMWGYQKMTQSTQTSSTITQTENTPITTIAITTPTPLTNPNQALQRFSSSTNPYTFYYPESTDWQVFSTTEAMGDSVSVSCDTCVDAKIDLFQVTPVIFTSIEEYMQKDTLTTDKTAITLNGLPAIRGIQSGSEQAGGSFVVVFVVKDKKGYLLQQRYAGLYNKTKFSDIPQVEPDILGSFNFSDM